MRPGHYVEPPRFSTLVTQIVNFPTRGKSEEDCPRVPRARAPLLCAPGDGRRTSGLGTAGRLPSDRSVPRALPFQPADKAASAVCPSI